MTRRLHDALVGAAVVLTVEEFGGTHWMLLAAGLATVAAVGAALVDGWRRARARQRVGWRQ